jgi:GNAT superfamily N-acetyltransferase
MTIRIRKAVVADIPALQQLLEISVRGLQAGDYTPRQIEGTLRSTYGVDSQLIADGTYYVAEADTDRESDVAALPKIVGCGGWSKRRTLFGGDQCSGREDELLDPRSDAAKIRAFFVHPDWSRKGIGTLLLDQCERAAKAAGFTSFEMGATLTGVLLYRARGYVDIERIEVPLPDGERFPIVRMKKTAAESRL